jgi:hypothetical protein
METEQIKGAADRMKDDQKLPPDSELGKAVKEAKEAGHTAAGDVKVAVKVPKIVQGDEGRVANGE